MSKAREKRTPLIEISSRSSSEMLEMTHPAITLEVPRIVKRVAHPNP